MADWQEMRLGDLVCLEYGSALHAESRTGRGFPVYGSNGIVGQHDIALVSGPGIIVGRKGSVGALQWSRGDFWPIDTTYWVRPTVSLDLRWMRDALGMLSLETLDSSTGVPGLNRADAYELSLPVPPSEEQRRIAEILDTIDETIRATERIIAKYEDLGAGVSVDFLSNIPEREVSKTITDTQSPPSSSGASIGSDSDELSGYMTLAEIADLNPESLGAETPPDRAFKYIDLSSVSQGSIDEMSLENLRFADAPSRARRVVRSGDVLFGTVRPGLRSHARVVGDGYVASTGFCVTRPRPGVADSSFLGHFLLSDQAARQALQREVGSNYPAVTERDVAVLRLPVYRWSSSGRSHRSSMKSMR